LIDREQLDAMMGRLTAIERAVVQGHFGLGDRRSPATYAQLAALLGVTRRNVQQIQASAMSKLKADARG
jgi:DNA-directed RNA polymerase sigma subunit (sigma70/sigma32)